MDKEALRLMDLMRVKLTEEVKRLSDSCNFKLADEAYTLFIRITTDYEDLRGKGLSNDRQRD